VIPFRVPSLRERREDIPLLVSHFIKKLGPRANPQVRRIDESALARLSTYAWPGNVRELENAIEQSLVFANGDSIDIAALPGFLREGASESTLALPGDNMSLPEILDDLERQLIQRAYDRTGGVKTETARLLGIKTSALYYKLEKYGIGTTAGRPSGAPKI
jgi:two-component system response regulator HydG